MATATIGRPSAAGAAAARQKKILIGGAVLLGVILVVQVPRTMKMLGGSETPAAATAPAPISPAPVTGTPPATPVVPAAPTVGEGKLVSFERFRSKDPFVQQVVAGGSTAPAAETPADAGAGTPATDGSAGGATADDAATGTTSFSSDQGASTTSGAQKATLTVNGKQLVVGKSKTFPTADPVFKLVAVGDDSVEIAIADGSLNDGGKTVTLNANEPLTLLNTADGKRYRLVLLSTSG